MTALPEEKAIQCMAEIKEILDKYDCEFTIESTIHLNERGSATKLAITPKEIEEAH